LTGIDVNTRVFLLRLFSKGSAASLSLQTQSSRVGVEILFILPHSIYSSKFFCFVFFFSRHRFRIFADVAVTFALHLVVLCKVIVDLVERTFISTTQNHHSVRGAGPAAGTAPHPNAAKRGCPQTRLIRRIAAAADRLRRRGSPLRWRPAGTCSLMMSPVNPKKLK